LTFKGRFPQQVSIINYPREKGEGNAGSLPVVPGKGLFKHFKTFLLSCKGERKMPVII